MENNDVNEDEIRLFDRKQVEVDVNRLSRMEVKKMFQSMPSRMKTLKVGVRTWDSLKKLKRENETFDDVIKDLLNERTKELGDENIKAIKFQRKVVFFTWEPRGGDEIGFEFEYNDVKNNKNDFVLDLKIKKVFIGRRIMNPSEFFGVDNSHKHFSTLFLFIYLKSVVLALKREFRIEFPHYDINRRFWNIALWRQFYYEYNLSQESFISDIEDPLRLSEEEGKTEKWINKIENSPSSKYSKEV